MSSECPNSEIVNRLVAALGEKAVLTGDEVRSRSAGLWGPPAPLKAGLLVRPADTEGVSRVLAICHEFAQPVVTHGGLTGIVGGADAGPGDLVLSLERLRGIDEVDVLERVMLVGAGTPLEVVQQEADRHGLLFPLDLGARGSATIGGNAATNAGGNQVLRYGMIRQLILGLEAVLADGTVISSMNRVLKNNAGYDVKQLFIGSEGTLGVVTRLVLRLSQRPGQRDTAIVAVDDFAAMGRLLGVVDGGLGGALSTFEAMWGDYYRFILERGAHRAPLDDGYAFYVLIEAWGGEGNCAALENSLADAMESGLVRDAVVAKSEAERERIWAIRDDVVRLLDLEPMFLFDVSVPLGHMEDYVALVRATLTERWADHDCYVFGHLGDGNLHLGVRAGPADGSARTEVEEVVYRPLGAIGGSISGEHGIGLEKRAYLSWCRTEQEIGLMRTLKAGLDPQNILNPGKIF